MDLVVKESGMAEKKPRTEQAAAQLVVQPFREQINADSKLMSILYDIDLLPEQIRTMPNAMRMMAFCEVWKGGRKARIVGLIQARAAAVFDNRVDGQR